MPETRQPRIEHALELLDRETTCATDERAAFDRFRSRVERIEPVGAATASVAGRPGSGTTTLAGTSPRPDSSSRTIRAAYRETVGSVPHFEDDYDETLAEHFRAELGTALTVQVFGSGQVTAPVRETLLSSVDRAIEERSTYLATLRTERESLCSVRDRLDDCEAQAAELGASITSTTNSRRRSAVDQRLSELEATCEELVESRQELLHGRSTARLVGISGESLARLLYAECEVTCPALADIADCLDVIRHQRERCLR